MNGYHVSGTAAPSERFHQRPGTLVGAQGAEASLPGSIVSAPPVIEVNRTAEKRGEPVGGEPGTPVITQ